MLYREIRLLMILLIIGISNNTIFYRSSCSQFKVNLRIRLISVTVNRRMCTDRDNRKTVKRELDLI